MLWARLPLDPPRCSDRCELPLTPAPHAVRHLSTWPVCPEPTPSRRAKGHLAGPHTSQTRAELGGTLWGPACPRRCPTARTAGPEVVRWASPRVSSTPAAATSTPAPPPAVRA